MSNDLNCCSFIGRLGRDPETRYTGGGEAVANFSLGVGWKTKNEDGTEWVRVSCFGKLAELVTEYCKKGKQVFVMGRLRTREYEKDGQKRYATEIVADRIQFLGGGERQESGARPRAEATAGVGPMDDDVPF